MRFTRITIIKIKKPNQDHINEELQFLGESLGLFSERDKDKSCFRIFITLVKSLKAGQKLTSDEIAEHNNLTRGTVIHHLNRLMESGIVVSQKGYYMLAVDTMEELVELVKNNLVKTFDNLKTIARNVDKKLDL
ncbi:MAG TPA: helix-turn-helix domain-containing protein [Alphaproteobacteria bacterium]|nr:helix-turn-helix domain-containing protein [Alphaproteobacteria bacterium]